MPNVTAPVRLMQSGEAITQFTDTASTTATTFTYPNQQEGLNVTNKGFTTITLTVNGTNYTIQPGQNQNISAVFTTFTIQSLSGTQQFDASAWSYEKDDVRVTGSYVPVNGQKDVISGTAVQLSSASNRVNRITVVAKKTNTSTIYVGDSGVNDTNGIILDPGEGFEFRFVDLSAVYVYGTSGDGVFYGGEK